MDLETTGPLIRAAQYVRMSTDHQQYSTANQSDAICAYAAKRGMEIVRTYADEGRSGLTLDRRDALKQLIEDVQTGRADFQTILVYDVSRWGRFQDADESAYYEYICKRAGIGVHYCAEQFDNDGTPLSAIIKSIKRAMAGEFSRELSNKTFAAQCRIVQLGYRLGALPGYGMRRMLIDHEGNPKGELAPGEWKSITRHRIILVPGPSQEIATVRRIYSAFARKRRTESQIADMLNKRGSRNGRGRPWNRHSIKYILRNEKYIGNNVWNRTSFKLHKTLVSNAPDMWLRAEGAFEAIIEKSLFDAAQAIYRDRAVHPIGGRPRRYSDEEMLERLRRLLKRYGYLNKALLDKSAGIQGACAYEKRFGSLTRAYRLIGYSPKNRKRKRIRPHKGPHLSDAEMLEKLQELLRLRGNLSQSIIEETRAVPSRTAYVSRFGGLKNAYRLIGFTPDPYRKLSPRPHGLTDEELLEALRKLLRDYGRISQEILYTNKGVPSYYIYQKRFGGLVRACRMIGYAAKH